MNIGLLLPILAVFVALEILRTGTCMIGDLVSSRWCFQAAHIAIPSGLLMIETGGRSGLSWFPLSVASLVWQSLSSPPVWAFAFPILRQLLEPDLAVPPIFHGQPGAVVFEVFNGQHLPGPGAKPLIWVVPSDFIPALEFAPPIVLA